MKPSLEKAFTVAGLRSVMNAVSSSLPKAQASNRLIWLAKLAIKAAISGFL
ncbi:hypothetical protein D3C72_2464860 [compost metagenome]